MKYEISRIDPWSLAKITGFISLALTIVISLPYAGMTLLFSGAFDYWDATSSLMIFGIAGFLGLIVMSYVMGVVSGFVIAFIYNWIADHNKGIQIDINLVEEKK